MSSFAILGADAWGWWGGGRGSSGGSGGGGRGGGHGGGGGSDSGSDSGSDPFTLMVLDYDMDALEPYISEEVSRWRIAVAVPETVRDFLGCA